jgi:hypothetical protein
MASWFDIEAAAPHLAAFVQERFDAHGLGLLATLRRDGAPRISGIEPLFAMGELWLGMMPGSRKVADLLRDPRFALHSATADKNVTHGDATILGRAVLVDDEATLTRFLEAFKAHNGYAPPPSEFPLFRADVQSLSTVRPAGDHLDINWWREGESPQHIERR